MVGTECSERADQSRDKAPCTMNALGPLPVTAAPAHRMRGKTPCTVRRRASSIVPGTGSPDARQDPMHLNAEASARSGPWLPHRKRGKTSCTVRETGASTDHRPLAQQPNAAPRQNPMHQFARLSRLRRPSGPEIDIIDVLPEPHAPIHAVSSARQAGAGNTPCPADNCPTGAAPRLARSALETMVRLARDRPRR